LLLIDRYAYTNKLKDFNPMAKFIFAIGALFVAVGFNNLYINFVIFLMMVFLTTIVAGIPSKNYFKIYLVPFLFLFISILTIIISRANEDIFLWSFKIGKSYFGIKEESLTSSIVLIFRVLACLSSTFFIALTTPINHLIKIFKKLKLPPTIIELIILIYRFIFVFLEESKEISFAQEMRFGYIGIKNTYRSIGLLMKCLFIRVLLKYEDMINSLDAKLYNGDFKIG